MGKVDRAIILVCDSVGVGALDDAAHYGDAGSNTLAHIAQAAGGLNLPNLASLGLGNIADVQGVPPSESPRACYGRMNERSAGKDSTSGHWEIAGVIVERPFPTFRQGFPPDLIQAFERAIGRPVLGNCVASGTEIMDRLGSEHLATGRPIVYTSADSVFQIAAHVDVVTIDELYEWCGKARVLLDGDFRVGRVIARPFEGPDGVFRRRPERRDFSVEPPGRTLCDVVSEAALPVVGIGKVPDLFQGRGITHPMPTKSNDEGMKALTQVVSSGGEGLVFATLVDFDMLYGHRNDPLGYARALEQFDRDLGPFIEKLRPRDLLFITADHGNDPTTKSTDHSREYVPILVTGASVETGKDLGTRSTFADLGATAADLLGCEPLNAGSSFAEILFSRL